MAWHGMAVTLADSLATFFLIGVDSFWLGAALPFSARLFLNRSRLFLSSISASAAAKTFGLGGDFFKVDGQFFGTDIF